MVDGPVARADAKIATRLQRIPHVCLGSLDRVRSPSCPYIALPGSQTCPETEIPPNSRRRLWSGWCLWCDLWRTLRRCLWGALGLSLRCRFNLGFGQRRHLLSVA